MESLADRLKAKERECVRLRLELQHVVKECECRVAAIEDWLQAVKDDFEKQKEKLADDSVTARENLRLSEAIETLLLDKERLRQVHRTQLNHALLARHMADYLSEIPAEEIENATRVTRSLLKFLSAR